MSISYEEFLTSAKALAENPKSLEIDLRNAVSRAYYAAFHACNSSVNLKEYENTGSHENLIRSMLDSSDNELVALGLQLRKCKIKRHKADYKLNQSVLIGETNQVITECSKILDAISSDKEKFKANI